MYLNTLTSADFAILPKKFARNTVNSLRTDDIEGAHPRQLLSPPPYPEPRRQKRVPSRSSGPPFAIDWPVRPTDKVFAQEKLKFYGVESSHNGSVQGHHVPHATSQLPAVMETNVPTEARPVRDVRDVREAPVSLTPNRLVKNTARFYGDSSSYFWQRPEDAYALNANKFFGVSQSSFGGERGERGGRSSTLTSAARRFFD